MSVKEAVRIAQSNNFMGLVCSSRLLVWTPSYPSNPESPIQQASPRIRYLNVVLWFPI